MEPRITPLLGQSSLDCFSSFWNCPLKLFQRLKQNCTEKESEMTIKVWRCYFNVNQYIPGYPISLAISCQTLFLAFIISKVDIPASCLMYSTGCGSTSEINLKSKGRFFLWLVLVIIWFYYFSSGITELNLFCIHFLYSFISTKFLIKIINK